MNLKTLVPNETLKTRFMRMNLKGEKPKVNDKLQKKYRAAEEEIAGEALDTKRNAASEAARMRAMFVLGGITVAKKAANSFNTEAIKSLTRFQEDKMHEDLGYATFVDFLNESEFSPMTKAQFYEGKALLEKEGEGVFDLLTQLGISARKRKLLGKGNVELAGDKLIIHDGDEVTEIPITDKSSIFDAIISLADANAEKNIKLARQKEQIEKHGDEKRKLYDDLDKARASQIADVASQPHMIARVELGLAFRKLTEAAGDLSAIEKDQFRDGVLEDVAGWRTALAASYATERPAKRGPVELKGEDLDEQIKNFIDENVDFDNDEDLASKL